LNQSLPDDSSIKTVVLLERNWNVRMLVFASRTQ
jgi:hypothetical protein